MLLEHSMFFESPLLLAMLTLIACVVAGTSTWFFCRPQQGPGYWCSCCWLLLASYCAFLSNENQAQLWLTCVSNVLLIQAQVILMLGILRFLGQTLPWWLLPVCGGLQLSIDLGGAQLALAQPFRDAAYCATVMFMALFVAKRMRQSDSRDTVQAVTNFILCSLGAFILAHLLRLIVGVHDGLLGDPGRIFLPGSIPWLSLYSGLPFLVIALVALTAMSLHRTLAQSHQLAEQAHANLLRFEQLMQISSAAMLMVRDGRIEECNTRLSEMFGASRDALQGQYFEQLFYSDGPADDSATFIPGQTQHRIAKRADQSRFQAEVTLLSLGDEQCLAEIRDVTRQKTMEAKLTYLANIDPLTNALNRRAFAERYEHARRKAKSLCLAMLDLDHFKQINDRFGHAVGDEVLATFARLCQAQARQGDLFARIGGEEFVLVLIDCRAADAQLFLAHLRATLAATDITGIPLAHRISFSAGLVDCPEPGKLETVLRLADLALYQAKQNGRDRVETDLLVV